MKNLLFIIHILIFLPIEAQEIAIHNKYVYSSSDSILTRVDYEFGINKYSENEWKPLIINNKIDITILNNKEKPILFYLDTNNINALDSQYFPYENDLGILSCIILDKKNIPVTFGLKTWHLEGLVDKYGKPKNLYSIKNDSISWDIYKNNFNDLFNNFFIVNPNEKIYFSIEFGLPIDIDIYRRIGYDYSKKEIYKFKLIYSQSAKIIEELAPKEILNKIKKGELIIFDGIIESNNVDIIQLGSLY